MITVAVIILIISIILLALSILTAGDSDNSMGSLVGSSDLDLFKETKERGTKKWLIRLLYIFGIIFIIVSVILKVLI